MEAGPKPWPPGCFGRVATAMRLIGIDDDLWQLFSGKGNKMAITSMYIEMCRKAKMLQGLYIFKEDDLFYSPSKNIEIFEKYFNNKLSSTIGNLYPIDECFWLPAVEQIKELFRDFIDDPDPLFQQFLDDKKRVWKYPWPQVYFRSEEERWLALYMAEKFKLFWDNTRKEWFGDEDF